MTLFTRGDTKPDLSGVATSDGQPTSLAGATLAVHIRHENTRETLTLVGVHGPTPGSWSAPWPPGGVPRAGRHTLEVQATWPGDDAPEIQTFGPVPFLIGEQIA